MIRSKIRFCLVLVFAAGLFPGACLAQSVAGISVPGVINLGGGLVGGVAGAAGGAVGGIGTGLGGAVGGAVGGIGGAVGGIGGAVGGGLGGGDPGGGIGTGIGGVGGGVSTIALAVSGVTSFTPVDLPASLLPGRRECTRTARNERECRDAQDPNASLSPRPGTPTAVVQACRNTVVASSLRYGVARVDAASAGPMVMTRAGADAPIEFRMIYERASGPEVRHATIRCRLDNAGRVVAAS